MRGTKRFERRITTPYFKVGTLKSVSGGTSVSYDSYSGAPCQYLKIKGATVQSIQNLAQAYSSTIKNADAYSPAGVNGAYCLALPSRFVGKNLTYRLSVSGALGGVVLYLSDGASALFSNLTPLCSSSGKTYTVSGSTFTHLVFTNVYTTDKESEDGVVSEVRDGIIDFWSVCNLSITSEICPDFEAPVVSAGDRGVRVTFNIDGASKTVALPTKTTTKDGIAFEMLFSEYDELVLYALKKRVVYREGSIKLQLSGGEPWAINEEIASASGGVFAYFDSLIQINEGYCQYFDYVPWLPPTSRKNVFSIFDGSKLAIKLERNKATSSEYTQSLGEITSFLKGAYAAGVGATVIARRRMAIERDITGTSLAETLLAKLPSYGTSGQISAVGYQLNPRLELAYYSLDEGDSATLTVLCRNESGNEISRTEYVLRKGSAYKLTAPEIDGYTPIASELWGAIKDDKTITLEYKEK